LKPSESALTTPTQGITPAKVPETSTQPPAPTPRIALLSNQSAKNRFLPVRTFVEIFEIYLNYKKKV
jgi:hypothetical protein